MARCAAGRAKPLRMLFVVLVSLLAAGPAVANTRLGLHVTSDELAIWRARMTDSFHTINGKTFQFIYQNRLKADADRFLASGGMDSTWEGYLGTGCAPSSSAQPGFVSPGSWNGQYHQRAAFVYMLDPSGGATYGMGAATRLLAQTNTGTFPGTDFGNGHKWCVDHFEGELQFQVAPWVISLLHAYDYLKIGGYSFTAAQKTQIDTWFRNAATMMHDGTLFNITQHSYHTQIFHEPPNYACTVDCDDARTCSQLSSTTDRLYFNGPLAFNTVYFPFFNQTVPPLALAAEWGVTENLTTLLTNARKYFTAWVAQGIWEDGAVAEFCRWRDCSPPCAGSMWMGHGGVIPLILLADTVARAGDTSL